MWSTFKEGFSEFASVVTQDVKNVMNSVQESLNNNNQGDDDYDEGNDDNQDFSSSPKTNNNNNSSPKIDPNSPAGVLSKIQPFEFAKDIPDFPSSSSVGQEVLENWKKQVRALQENLHGTYVTPLDEADENSFTPSWLRTGAIDEETGVPNDSSEKELFAVGQQLLRSSQTVRNQFQQLFPEAQHHSLESLQDLIVEINNEQKTNSEIKTQRLLPSSFLVRYVVRLNKLFFHVKHGEYVSQREAAGQAKQIRHQKEKIKEQEETIRNLNEKLSDLEQEKKNMAATISDQETLIRQLRLDLERTKLLLNTNAVAAVTSSSQHNDNENNNSSNRQSSSSVDMIATPVAEIKVTKREKNEDDDEEWTEIA